VAHKAFESSESYIRIDMDLYMSEAFQILTPACQLVLIDFIGRYRTIRENWITFSWSQRRNRRIGSRTFKSALVELVTQGFIEKKHENGQRAVYAESETWRREARKNRGKKCTATGAKSAPLPGQNLHRTGAKSAPDRGKNCTAFLNIDIETTLDPPSGGPSVASEGPPGGDRQNNGTERVSGPGSTLRAKGNQPSFSPGFANNGTERDCDSKTIAGDVVRPQRDPRKGDARSAGEVAQDIVRRIGHG
jgi:hypothetical protein